MAIGGQDCARDSNSLHKNNILQKNREELVVWVITVSGRIYFRQNVYSLRPEGESWIEVSFSEVLSSSSDNEQENQQDSKIEEISKIAVGPAGNCWCLTSSGCLVRLGVTRDNLMGKSWICLLIINQR